jgi:hypothetical protein
MPMPKRITRSAPPAPRFAGQAKATPSRRGRLLVSDQWPGESCCGSVKQGIARVERATVLFGRHGKSIRAKSLPAVQRHRPRDKFRGSPGGWDLLPGTFIPEDAALLDQLDTRRRHIFLPIGIPGLDHSENLFREDVQVLLVYFSNRSDPSGFDQIGI